MHCRLTFLVAASFLAACGPADAVVSGVDGDDEALSQALSRKILGDTTCAVGAADCNVCVNDVVSSLEAGFGGRFRWTTGEWKFEWKREYPPSDARPLELFHDGQSLLQIPEHHVQGFVHTNDPRVPFIVTHSDDQKGGIGRIGAGGKLVSLVKSSDNHPSGGQVLGSSFLFAEGPVLRVINVAGAERSLRHALPAPSWARAGASLSGGGVGAVKLRDGRTLVVSSTPGGEGTATRRTLFFAKAGPLTTAGALTLIGETAYSQPNGWSGDYQKSENLSVVTECGTGKIFTLHATGDLNPSGRGYFRLSRVDTDAAGAPTLVTVKAFPMDQNIWDCHLRSAGTAWATPDHKIGLACHQWLDRRGIFGWETVGEFAYRTAKY